ncbi:MAG TPA: DUF881 domain-containing protein [Stackebrandtia sp.]|uniref:DUF881 domain-containing protein n=1 Tax=Stackebrandtia sp. TaxID=2023065 RepID=UPI002D667D96|nr:DUF881 domain-containing protein [Stackebrandtia sp.]HZE41630.1 DUF881 domain-containing protein [Stackebrandtia sp.]
MRDSTARDGGSRQPWSAVFRRALARVRHAAGVRRLHRRWGAATAAILLAAGALFAATAHTARGTNLRDDRDAQLRDLIPRRDAEVGALEERAAGLRDKVDSLASADGSSDAGIAAQRKRYDAYAAAVGLTAVHGPGVTVSLNDAPRADSGELPKGATVDDVVVHQQDVQAVVNALWAGGAEAMTIMNVRVIGTSAVRCVGNTLLLHGRVYSPPFVISAIGDTGGMSNALEFADGVRAFRLAAKDFGLGYSVEKHGDIRMPAYNGPLDLVYAKAPSK